jgi:hypothetical protein
MKTLRRDVTHQGTVASVLRDLRSGWLATLFGARLEPLPSTEREPRGLVLWGPLEVSLAFSLVAETPAALTFELTHGPCNVFLYSVRTVSDGGDIRLTETVGLELPWYFGGDWAVRRVARALLPSFVEARS